MPKTELAGYRMLDGRLNLQLFAQDKTEPPTPKRRRDARKKGQVAKSHDLGTALVLLVAFPVLYALIASMGEQMAAFTYWTYTEALPLQEWSERTIQALGVQSVLQVAKVALPVAAVGMLAGFVAQLVQVGFLVTAEPIKPKPERLNPIAGLKRIFSKRAAFELVKAVLKTAVIAWICYTLLRRYLPLFPHLALLHPAEAVRMVGDAARWLGVYAGVLLLVLGAGDYAFQRFEHVKSLRMSKQELKEELKETEGDPHLRSRLRQRQREIATRRMIHDVPKADVVVTNPTHIAVAIQYDAARMDAPVVVAKGAGTVAERIKEVAREHDVAIVENQPLARALFDTVPVGSEIPADLYQAVAEVLAFVYRLQGRTL